MSRQTDDLLRDAMRRIAGEVGPAHGLAARAVARGRRMRLHRRVGALLAAVVAVVAVGTPYVLLRPGTPVAILSPSVGPTGSASPSHYPRSTGPTSLPEAPGVPGAADRPDLVGTDPGVLHMDIQLSIFPNVVSSTWQSEPGAESIQVTFDQHGLQGRALGVTIARDEHEAARSAPQQRSELREEITVHGRPATLERYPQADSDSPSTWVLRWQPVDGLWAVLDALDATDATLRLAAETLRLDRAQHCAQPLVATVVPAGARWSACHVSFLGSGRGDGVGAWRVSGFTVTNSGGGTLSLQLGLAPPPDMRKLTEPFQPNRTVGQYPAMWLDAPHGIGELRIDDYAGEFDLDVIVQQPGLTEADALAVAGGLRLVGDLGDPATWSTRAVP